MLPRSLATGLSLCLLSLPVPVLLHTFTEVLLGNPRQRLADRVGAADQRRAAHPRAVFHTWDVVDSRPARR